MKEHDPRDRHPVWDELDDLTRRRLLRAMREPLDEEGEFIAFAWVGPCIHCGSERTMDLCEVEGVENAAVGLCKDCGGLWCTECRAPIVTPDLDCGHFAVCERCGQCISGIDPLADRLEGSGDAGEYGEATDEEPLEGYECWAKNAMEDPDEDFLEDLEEEEEEYVNPIECDIIREWLIDKGFYTREDFYEYDRMQREEEEYGDLCNVAAHLCAWCRKPFDEDGTIFTSRLELKPGLDLEGEEGLVVPLHLSSVGRLIPAIFFTLPLPGDRGIKGLNVVTCSLECLEELREAFDREREIIERFNVN